MKATKGLYLNSEIDDIPEGFTAFCRNGVLNYKDGSITKEKGFRDLNQRIPYTLIGKIETAEETFIFSTDNKNSAISRFKNDQLDVIVDDKFNNVFKLGFNTNNPIRGEALKNYKNEWIITWIDLLNPIRSLNTTNPKIRIADDLLLFPQYDNPNLEFTVQQGGTLPRGTYIPFIRYIDTDYTYSDFVPVSKPIFIGEPVKRDVTNRQIKISLSNLDTDYQFYEIGLYFIQDGAIKAYVVDKRQVYKTATLTLSNLSQFDNISVDELLINAPYYKQANAIIKFQDRLGLLGVEEYEEVDYQKWANDIKVYVKSQLLDQIEIQNNCALSSTINVLDSPEYGSGNYRTYIHDEVYGLAIALVLTNGRKTKGFHIPGRAKIPSDFGVSSVDPCYKKFQIENTCEVLDKDTGVILPGYWENSDEVYPDGFGITGNIRHHKMPSIDFCKEKLYSNNKDYQINILDRLGIIVDNVIIPDELKNSVVGYEIYYAKRTFDNQTFLGQSLTLLSSVDLKKDGTGVESNAGFKSTGGNFYSYWHGDSNDLGLDPNQIRLNSFDLNYFKPIVANPLLKNIGKLTFTTVRDAYTKLDIDSIVNVWDYTLNTKTTFEALPDSEKYYKTLKSTYLPNNAYLGKYDNRALESTFIVQTEKGLNIVPTIYDRQDKEVTVALVNQVIVTGIFSIKNNLYSNFYEQELVYTGKINTGIRSEVIYGGDGFIGNYSFITYGLRESNDLNIEQGQRFLYKFLVESNANVSMRYEEDGNIYSKFYPQSDSEHLKLLSRDKEPNVIGYLAEYNKTYDISKMSMYNFYEDKDVVTAHYNRGILSAEESKEKGRRSHKTFYALDYFEIEKSKGIIVDAHAFDRHIVVITENSIFTNLDINRLGNDEEIFVKSLNVTDQTFVEILDDEKGVIGTKHRFANAVTPLGLFIVDQASKNIYLFKDGLNKLNKSINTFIKDNLNQVDDNPFTRGGYLVSFDPQHNDIKFTQKSDKPFTLSYNLEVDNWTSFHDYIPDCYIGQRSNLYSVSNNKIYKHNEGDYGRYYTNDIKPFYIDIVVRDEQTFRMNNVSWLSKTTEEFRTFTHLMIYNSYQCTGRIQLYQATWNNFNLRKSKGYFFFDMIRNELNVRTFDFLTDLYLFKQLKDNMIGSKEWYNKEELDSNVAIIRLEDDNLSNNAISLMQLAVNIEPVMR